jgi:hypothetical protein
MILISKHAGKYKVLGLWLLYLEKHCGYRITCIRSQEALETGTSAPVFLYFSVFHLTTLLVAKTLQLLIEKSERSGGRAAEVPLCPPQIPHGVSRN